jgi:hypothetical protein
MHTHIAIMRIWGLVGLVDRTVGKVWGRGRKERLGSFKRRVGRGGEGEVVGKLKVVAAANSLKRANGHERYDLKGGCF